MALETPKSQAVDAFAHGAETLPWRASLLSHLLATQKSTAAVARRLGVGAADVTVVDADLTQPVVPTDTATAAAKATAGDAFTPYVLTVDANQQVAVISIGAGAVDTDSAKRLAAAAVAVFESQSSHRGLLRTAIPTNLGGESGLQPFVVTQILPIRAKVITSSSPRKKPIIAALFVFIIWCLGTLVVLPRMRLRGRLRGGAEPA